MEKEGTGEYDMRNTGLAIRLSSLALLIALIGLAFYEGFRWGILLLGFSVQTWGFYRLVVIRNYGKPTWFILLTGLFLVGCSVAVFHGVSHADVLMAIGIFFLVEAIAAVMVI